jgi:putative membrane protein
MAQKQSAAGDVAGKMGSKAFVTKACVSDLYEVQAGRLAAEQGRSDAVREFGQMMVEHHTSAKHQMQAALMSSEVTRFLPDLKPVTTLDERREGMLDQLRLASGDDFDRTYLDQQRQAHEEAVSLLGDYAATGDNPQLRSVALGGLPMVERHLSAVERIGLH